MAELIDQYPVLLLLPEALVAAVILGCIIVGGRRSRKKRSPAGQQRCRTEHRKR
jgi:hypothetical protein